MQEPPTRNNPRMLEQRQRNPREIFRNLSKEEFTPKKSKFLRTLGEPQPKNSHSDDPPPPREQKHRKFEKNLKWNEIDRDRGCLSLTPVTDKGLEISTRRKKTKDSRRKVTSTEKIMLGSDLLEKKFYDRIFDSYTTRKTVTNEKTVEHLIFVDKSNQKSEKISILEEDEDSKKKKILKKMSTYSLEDLKTEGVVKKGRKIFEKKEDSLKKIAKKMMKPKNSVVRKTPASNKKTIALRSVALEEVEDLRRLEYRDGRQGLGLEDLRLRSTTPSKNKIGRKLFENWQEVSTSTSLVEGASPPPINGNRYGSENIRSGTVVHTTVVLQTGRKPLCGTAPIGSRWVPQLGGGAHTSTGQGVGDKMGLYGWSSPGYQTKPRPTQALGGEGHCSTGQVWWGKLGWVGRNHTAPAGGWGTEGGWGSHAAWARRLQALG